MPDISRPSRWAQTRAPGAVILIRLMVGLVFFEEGIQKFLFPAIQGAGRFARIGIPAPAQMAYFVGAVEVICGALIVLGLFTRLAAIPLLIDISVAIASTKIPILLGHGYWHFHLPQLSRYGMWAMFSEARTDFSMLLGLLFLLIAGAGPLSIDGRR
ncbi:MAG TPA: DoxX family protein [Candidatus Acidoferrales bacterium]|nr:DoxX family protein [Candidatus Acidoferrales bacterium]